LCNAKYGYAQALGDLLNSMTSSLKIYDNKDQPGIFIIYSYQLIPAETDLLFTVARVVFSEKTGIYFRNISPETRSSGRDNH
jgi:cellobiose phosphorylase